jgi:hypothetical protein
MKTLTYLAKAGLILAFLAMNAAPSAFAQSYNNNMSVSCYASPQNAQVNSSVTWYATASGGNGNYSYTWTGGNGFSGTGQTISQYYTTSGLQTATVNVNSNGMIQSASCSTYVGNNNNNNCYNNGYNNNYNCNNNALTAYCYASPSTVTIGTPVTWQGSAMGGNGNYYYSWTGTNGLYGNNQIISQNYSIGGTQTATLTVTSNGQTAVANCIVNVTGGYYPTNYTGYPPNYTGTGTYYPYGTPSSGVYLSNVPYTGAEPNLKVALFILGLFLWSSFGAFMIIRKKEEYAPENSNVV